jgi:hypothetical protein
MPEPPRAFTIGLGNGRIDTKGNTLYLSALISGIRSLHKGACAMTGQRPTPTIEDYLGVIYTLEWDGDPAIGT